MSRCGCSSDCLCSVVQGYCILVTGNGSSTSPYVVGIVLDPNESNIIQSGPNGLLVTATPVEVADSDCISIEGDGSVGDPFVASPTLDPAPDNALTCGPSGLLVSVPGHALYNVVSVDADADAASGDLVVADTTAGDVTVTLPVANAGEAGRIVTVKKIVAANDLFLAGAGADFIDGGASLTLSAQWASATVVCTGSTWHLIGSV